MPLSKERNRIRMRNHRLHAKNRDGVVQPEAPLYNPSKHKPGDIVRVNGRIVTLPWLDAEGQPIPEY